MKLELDNRFRDRAKGRFGKYAFEVGVLKDGVHKSALSKKKGLKTFAGGPARKTGRLASGETIGKVSKANRERTDYLRKPFKKRSADIIKFSKSFFDLCFGKTEKQRCINLLQAIVRNPILRGDYGHNRRGTIRAKGFDRLMIDTGQLFTAIRARVVKGSRV